MSHDHDTRNSKKISDFVVDSAVTDSSLITYVKNGQNFTVTQAEYVKLFGTTGSLVQSGDPTATPVLDTQGSVNNIRNLEDGSGVKSSVSAQNGITLDHNFTVDGVGAPLMLNKTLKSPTFPSLLGSSTISVDQVGDQIRFTLTGAAVATKTVIVNQLSDFPAAVTGVITLAAETDYFLTNDITTSDRFNVSAGNIVVRATDSSIVTFEYTGTGDMFTGVDASFRLGRITLVALTGRCWNLSDSTGGSIFQFIDGTISGCDKIGIIKGPSAGFGAVQITNVAAFGVITDGIEFTGTIGAFIAFTDIAVMVNVGSFLNLGTATFGSFSVDDSLVDLIGAGSFFMSGATGSANILSGGLGVVLNSRVRGPGTALSGITPDDDRWRFLLNDEIRDSRTDGLLSLQGNATETVISGSSSDGSNAVLVAGTWAVESTSQMTGTTAGRLTHTGGKDARLPINAALSVEPVSGGATQINAYISIDGVIDVSSRQKATAASGSPNTIPISWQNTFPDNGFVEIFVENTVNSVNILVSSATFVVN